MASLFQQIQDLIARGEVKISAHGYDELAADGLTAVEVLHGVLQAVVLEEYPQYPKGPCVLVLQQDAKESPVHVVWGIPKGKHSPAVLVTAYRPDPQRWSEDFRRRKR